jgi:DNA adenine methylase
LAPGAGRIKNGEGGKGMKSRWYPATLEKRIREIVRIKDAISFIQGDGMTIMQEYVEHPDAIFFIDPPYIAPGKKGEIFAGWKTERYGV